MEKLRPDIDIGFPIQTLRRYFVLIQDQSADKLTVMELEQLLIEQDSYALPRS